MERDIMTIIIIHHILIEQKYVINDSYLITIILIKTVKHTNTHDNNI